MYVNIQIYYEILCAQLCYSRGHAFYFPLAKSITCCCLLRVKLIMICNLICLLACVAEINVCHLHVHAPWKCHPLHVSGVLFCFRNTSGLWMSFFRGVRYCFQRVYSACTHFNFIIICMAYHVYVYEQAQENRS